MLQVVTVSARREFSKRYIQTFTPRFSSKVAAVVARNPIDIMKVTKVNVYLKFDGNCAEAFDFYKEVFGGDFSWKSTWGKSPMADKLQTQQEKDKIMHVSLPLAKDMDLMGCDNMSSTDTCPSDDKDVTKSSKKKRKVGEEEKKDNAEDSEIKQGGGSNMAISIMVESKDRAEELMAALTSNGGVVVMPLADQFWGDYFGVGKDKYGFEWMISYHPEQSGENQ